MVDESKKHTVIWNGTNKDEITEFQKVIEDNGYHIKLLIQMRQMLKVNGSRRIAKNPIRSTYHYLNDPNTKYLYRYLYNLNILCDLKNKKISNYINRIGLRPVRVKYGTKFEYTEGDSFITYYHNNTPIKLEFDPVETKKNIIDDLDLPF